MTMLLQPRKILKPTLIIVIIVVSIFVVYWIVAGMALSGFPERKYTEAEAVANFRQHQKTIYDLAFRLRKIKPIKRGIWLKYVKGNTYSLGVYYSDGIVDSERKVLGGNSIRVSSVEFRSLIDSLKIDEHDVIELNSLLKNVNCKRIDVNDKEAVIIFSDRANAQWFYRVFFDEVTSDTIEWAKARGYTVLDKYSILTYEL